MAFKVFLMFSLFAVGIADINMHNPRGSNNRLDEPNRERRNQRRMFDSQNNNRGGYNVGGLYYYAGTKLQIQWALQHSCADPNNNCEVVLQYMCNANLRDGTTVQTIPDRPEQCYNQDCDGDLRFGMHENFKYYKDCIKRQRNKGLFTADQNMRGRETARFTRQDRNGQRYAYECPEERDYYPYWHPTPWKDIAVLTNDEKRCQFYRQQSENVRGRSYCKVNGDIGRLQVPNNEQACDSFKAGNNGEIKGEWISEKAHGIPPPDCKQSQWSRDNHQGNTIGGYFMSYDWTVPDLNEDKCILRIRYNISTGDYDGWDSNVNHNLNGAKLNVGARFGLDYDTAKARGYILKTNPDVQIFKDVPNFKVRVNIDTGNFGRTFQDRTHLFSIRKRPGNLRGKTIHNVNVRGKRGNIVEVFPAVEYDFVPNTLEAQPGDYVHFQWTGSNTNNRGNDGQGLLGTDRSNVVPLRDNEWAMSYPANISQSKFLGFDEAILKNLALLRPGQLHGETSELDDAGTYYDLGPKMVTGLGTHHYMCTRNNNFSNRSQKGKIIIKNSDRKETRSIGYIGGSVNYRGMRVLVPPGFLSKRSDITVKEMSISEGEHMITKEAKGVLPPGTGYASDFFVVSPQSKLGCESNPAEVLMAVNRTHGVNIYHSSEALGFKTWHRVNSRMGVAQAKFTTAHGGVFVARTMT